MPLGHASVPLFEQLLLPARSGGPITFFNTRVKNGTQNEAHKERRGTAWRTSLL